MVATLLKQPNKCVLAYYKHMGNRFIYLNCNFTGANTLLF